MAKLLLTNKVDVNMINTITVKEEGSRGMTALGIASKNGNLEMVKLLLANEADVHKKGKPHGHTALVEAVLKEQMAENSEEVGNSRDVIKELLDARANPLGSNPLENFKSNETIRQYVQEQTCRILIEEVPLPSDLAYLISKFAYGSECEKFHFMALMESIEQRL